MRKNILADVSTGSQIDTDEPIALGQYLRYVRKQVRRISLIALGDRTKTSVSFLSKIETGEAIPSPGILQQIAEALEISRELPQLMRMRTAVAAQKTRGKARRAAATKDTETATTDAPVNKSGETSPLLADNVFQLLSGDGFDTDSIKEAFKGLFECFIALGKELSTVRDLAASAAAFQAAEAIARRVADLLIPDRPRPREINEAYLKVGEAYLKVGEAFLEGTETRFDEGIAAYRIAEDIANRLGARGLKARVLYRLARTFQNIAWSGIEPHRQLSYFQLAIDYCAAAYEETQDSSGLTERDLRIRPYSCAVAGAVLANIADLRERRNAKQDAALFHSSLKLVATDLRGHAHELQQKALGLYNAAIAECGSEAPDPAEDFARAERYSDLLFRRAILSRGMELAKPTEMRDYDFAESVAAFEDALRYQLRLAKRTAYMNNESTKTDRKTLARYHQEFAKTLGYSHLLDRLERGLWQIRVAIELDEAFNPNLNASMKNLMLGIADMAEKATVHDHVEGLVKKQQQNIKKLDYPLFYEVLDAN
jgi:transcriptional regulator with XRE-family HTH domain